MKPVSPTTEELAVAIATLCDHNAGLIVLTSQFVRRASDKGKRALVDGDLKTFVQELAKVTI